MITESIEISKKYQNAKTMTISLVYSFMLCYYAVYEKEYVGNAEDFYFIDHDIILVA